MEKFSIGNAFAEAKNFVMAHFWLYLGLIFGTQVLSIMIMLLPFGGLAGMEVLMPTVASDPGAIDRAIFGAGALFFVALIVGIAIALSGNFIIWRHGFSKDSTSVGGAILYGLKVAIPILLFVILAYVALIAIIFIIVLLFGAVGFGLGSDLLLSGGLETGLRAIGVVALIGLAGFLVFTYFLARVSVMGPEMAAHNSLNPFAACARSWRTTRGNGWMILLFFVISYIVFSVIYAVASGLAGAIGAASGSSAVVGILTMVIVFPVLAFGALLSAALPAGVYRDLVAQKGGAEIFS